MSGSMSEVWKRSHGSLVRHRQAKAAETDRPTYSHRATPRLYLAEAPPTLMRPVFVVAPDPLIKVGLQLGD